MTTDRPAARRPRRPHAAAGGRLLVGGLSLSLLVTLVGGMVRGDRPSATTTLAPNTTTGPTTAPPPVPPPPQVTRPTAPPVTTSHAT